MHRDDAPSLAELRERYVKRDAPVDDPARLLHGVVDGLVDSFFPRLAAIDDRIDVLEDEIFRDADDAQLQEIFSMKRALVTHAEGDLRPSATSSPRSSPASRSFPA